MFYSASKNTWLPPELKGVYEASGSWPSDAKEYPQALYAETVSNRPDDKVLAPDAKGRPTLVDRQCEPMTREQVSVARRIAYANPVTGSDRFLTEAAAERLGGNEEAAREAEEKCAARRAEIAATFPWPAD